MRSPVLVMIPSSRVISSMSFTLRTTCAGVLNKPDTPPVARSPGHATAGRLGHPVEPLGPQGAAADLAGIVAERFADDLDAAWHLVADEAFTQEGEELVDPELVGV